MRNLAVTALAAMILAAPIAKAECVLVTDRTACPGKETEAFKPYAGKNPTEEKSKAASADLCLKDAEKASKIVRKGTLEKKVVTAKFDGKELGKKEDSKPCK